jgi:tRNA pseudouridine38-40 synthase
MPHRLKLIVAYDGKPFAGWQSQAGGNTVQDHLEAALSPVAGEPVRVHGAGRTDAGVHALGQCAHADVPRRTLLPERWVHALNASLPPTIRVLRVRYVSEKFHARFSATGKTYRYRIWNAPVLPPLELGRVWHVPVAMDYRVLQAAAREFAGTHDFAAFAANRGKPEESTTRTITEVRVRRAASAITLEFSGDGFLYKMVRLMVGALVRCGQGKMAAEEIRTRLRSPAAHAAAPRFVAPAEGLILLRVRY